jgi:hypothetical protein
LYTCKYIESLLVITLDSFLPEDEGSEEEGKWLVYRAASELLSELAQLCGDSVWNKTFDFFLKKLSTNDEFDTKVGLRQK